MRIKLLVASEDKDYCNRLSFTLSQNYADTFDISVCTEKESLTHTLADHDYDVGLFSVEMMSECNIKRILLSLVLWDSEYCTDADQYDSAALVRKYQRISHLASDVLQKFSAVSEKKSGLNDARAQICAVWSPAGGTGKTTVALAYAVHTISHGKKVLYLDMEAFSSVPVYFDNDGKSISEAFEQLGGNIELRLQGIRQLDSRSGIHYYCGPINYEDMYILTRENIAELIDAAASGMDAVVVDLSAAFDEKCKDILLLADRVLLVADGCASSIEKIQQFCNQSSLFEQIKEKTILVCNKGGRLTLPVSKTVQLDYVRSGNPSSVYKTLSAADFSTADRNE